MRGRGFAILVAAVLLALLGGVVYLGLNPPAPTQKPVEKVIPNDKFR